MRAAIYARRSTEEHQAASLDVQLSEAKRYIADRGWQLADGHIYIEDGVSRAEFVKRPALIKLLRGSKDRLFDVVVLRDETRLGGDMTRSTLTMMELIDQGTRIVYYFTDEEVRLDRAQDRLLVVMRNAFSEMEREKISQRTREHLAIKAKSGKNAGGRVYGYDNVRGAQGVEYAINPEQAEIVREVFESKARGMSARSIARALNDRGIRSPRAGKRGTGSWSPSQIAAMLRNERYTGVMIYGRVAKAYRQGTKVRLAQPEHEWQRVIAPELAIIDRATFDRVQPKRGVRGEPGGARHPRYTLSGLAKCGQCGGPIQAVRARHGRDHVAAYSCSYHRNRGPSVCTNSLRRPVQGIDDAIASWVQTNILTEAFITETISRLRLRLQGASKAAQAGNGDLVAEAERLRREIDNLVQALAATSLQPTQVIEAINQRSVRLQQVEAELAATRVAPRLLDAELRKQEQHALERLGGFRALLNAADSESRRTFYRALLKGPLVFTPIGEHGARRFRIEGETAIGVLFVGEFGERAKCDPDGPSSSVPTGILMLGPSALPSGPFLRLAA